MKSLMVFLILFIISLFFLLPFNCSTINTVINYEWDITVHSGLHGSVCNEGTRKCGDEDSLVLIVCSTDYSYQFKEWVIDSGKENCIVENKYSDTTKLKYFKGPVIIHPEFSARTYSLKFVSDSEGVVSLPVIDGLIYNSKTKINVVATAKDTVMYEFKGWSLDSGNAVIVNDSIVIAGNTILCAKYTIRKYQFTLTQPTAGGTISSSPASGASYDYGTKIKLTATPLTGWHFDYWTGRNTGNATTDTLTVTIGTSNNISAVFARNRYTLTVTQPTYGGTISVSPTSSDGKYDYQQSVTLAVAVDSGWAFTGWTGISGTNPQTFSIEQNTTVSATLQLIAVPIHVKCVKQNAPQNGGGTIGSNWVDAYRSLHDALSNATSGDSIWVAAGTYNVKTTDPTVTYKINSGIALYGGFNGTETALPQRDWINGKTILSGVCGSGKSDTIFCVQSGATNVLIDGFRITDAGRYSGYLRGSTKVNNCIITNNNSSAQSGGTALFIYASNCEIVNCIFSGNKGPNGTSLIIYTQSANTLIGNCIMAYNSGPTIYNLSSSTSIRKSTIVFNSAASTSAAGGINNTGTINLESTVLWGNTNPNDSLGTQINNTGYVDYCCIEDCDILGKGVRTKTSSWQNSTNTATSPGFVNVTLPTDDRNWFSTSDNTIAPFIPAAGTFCENQSYTNNSTIRTDIRGIARNIPYEIGVYERIP